LDEIGLFGYLVLVNLENFTVHRETTGLSNSTIVNDHAVDKTALFGLGPLRLMQADLVVLSADLSVDGVMVAGSWIVQPSAV